MLGSDWPLRFTTLVRPRWYFGHISRGGGCSYAGAIRPGAAPCARFAQSALLVLALLCAGAACASDLQIRIGYLAHLPPRGPLLSNVIPEPTDAGRRGAELAIADSNSTGRFLKQSYSLEAAESEDAATLLTTADDLHAQGIRLFVVNAPAATLRQLSQRLPDSLLLNAGSADDGLITDCP